MRKIEQFKAKNIRKLAEWHKKTCNIEDCGINLYLLIEDFQRHMGRKATQEEIRSFM